MNAAERYHNKDVAVSAAEQELEDIREALIKAMGTVWDREFKLPRTFGDARKSPRVAALVYSVDGMLAGVDQVISEMRGVLDNERKS